MVSSKNLWKTYVSVTLYIIYNIFFIQILNYFRLYYRFIKYECCTGYYKVAGHPGCTGGNGFNFIMFYICS